MYIKLLDCTIPSPLFSVCQVEEHWQKVSTRYSHLGKVQATFVHVHITVCCLIHYQLVDHIRIKIIVNLMTAQFLYLLYRKNSR